MILEYEVTEHLQNINKYDSRKILPRLKKHKFDWLQLTLTIFLKSLVIKIVT